MTQEKKGEGGVECAKEAHKTNECASHAHTHLSKKGGFPHITEEWRPTEYNERGGFHFGVCFSLFDVAPPPSIVHFIPDPCTRLSPSLREQK